MDKYQELQRLISDEAKAQEIFTESIEETQANLKQAGLEFSIEELEAIANQATPSGELGEDDLDNVSGGAPMVPIVPILVPIIIIGIVKKWKNR